MVESLMPVRRDLRLLKIPWGTPVGALTGHRDLGDDGSGVAEAGVERFVVKSRPRALARQTPHDLDSAAHKMRRNLVGDPCVRRAPGS